MKQNQKAFTKSSKNREIIYKTALEIINSSKDISSIKQDFVYYLGKVFECDRFFIRFFDNDLDEFKVIDNFSQYLASPDITSLINQKFDDEVDKLIKYSYKNNRPFIIKNIDEEPEQNSVYKQVSEYLKYKLNVKSNYCFPVLNNRELIGAFVVHYIREKRELSDEEIDLVNILASQFINTIYRGDLLKKNNHFLERENLLRLIIAIIRSSLDINTVKRNIVESVGQFFNADRCYIRLYNSESNSFINLDSNSEYLSSDRIESLKSYDFQNNDLSLSINCHKKKQEVIIQDSQDFIKKNNIKDSDIAYILNAYNVKSAVAMPILFNEELKGSLVLHFVKNKKFITHEDIIFLKLLTSHISVALHQTKLLEVHKKEALKQKLFSELMEMIKNSTEIDGILEDSFKILSKSLNINKIILYSLDKTHSKFERSTEFISSQPGLKKFHLSKNNEFLDYILEKVINKQEDSCSFENTTFMEKYKKINGDLNCKSIVAIEMKVKDNKYGALLVYLNENIFNCDENLEILHRVADSISIAMRDVSLYTKSQFIANVSHEFKTPLSIINGYTDELIKYEHNKETSLKYLNYIKDNGDKLSKLIDNILSLHLIELDIKDKKLFQEEFCLSDIVTSSINQCINKNLSKKISLEKKLEKVQYKGNPVLLQQAVSNLINNAIKYSSDRQKLKISLTEKNKQVIISVKDYGIGIEEKHLKNIFERFYRVDKSRSSKTGGTGLGLSIVKLIVEAHGGKVSAKSEINTGSTFYINLPII